MYLNTKRRSRNLKYIFLVLVILFLFDVFMLTSDGIMPFKSFFLMPLFLILLALRGPFELEYDRVTNKIKILNKSALFGRFLPHSSTFLEVENSKIRGFRVHDTLVRPSLWVQYENQSGEIEERTFCLWSLSKPERKDIKASLGRILTANRQKEKLAIS
jgi:hypothetical protein